MQLSPNARRLAAETSRDRPPQGTPAVWFEPGTVTAVTPGAASDGNALVLITYRGVSVNAAFLASYTPTVGHVVTLLVSSSGQILILGRVIGTP